MSSTKKTRDELQDELDGLRARIAELECAATAREQVLAALRETEDRFQLAVRGSSDGLWDWNIATNNVWWSRQYRELLGYEADDLPATYDSWESRLHPNDRERTLDALRRHIDEDGSYDIEYRLKTKNDGYRWFLSRGVVASDDTGKPLRMAGSIQDISDRKQTEAALRESEERFSLFMDHLPGVAFINDSEGRICYANAMYLRVVGRALQEVLGCKNADIFPSDVASRFAAQDDHVRTHGRVVVFDEVVSDTTGPRHWLTSKFPISREGQPSLVGGVSIDITERTQAERKLQTADRLAAIGTMVAGVAHEINSPLTVISGLAELLAKRRMLSGKAREWTNEIVQQASRCSKIVHDLLVFSRTGRVEFHTVQVNTIVKKCLDLFRDNNRFEDAQIVEQYGAELPDTMGDPYRLEQVFINILRNAGDALREVTSRKQLIVRTEHGGDTIRVAFTDTGTGIDDVEKIFDAFYTTKTVGEGTGLGLSVSRSIIQDHRGTLTAENTGEGTQVVVTLPIRCDR
jgi:PAS domain S-box-containing protein